MGHLACQDHKRRIHLIRTYESVMPAILRHRQDSSTCTSALVTIRGVAWTPADILLGFHKLLGTDEIRKDKPKLPRGERKRRRKDMKAG